MSRNYCQKWCSYFLWGWKWLDIPAMWESSGRKSCHWVWLLLDYIIYWSKGPDPLHRNLVTIKPSLKELVSFSTPFCVGGTIVWNAREAFNLQLADNITSWTIIITSKTCKSYKNNYTWSYSLNIPHNYKSTLLRIYFNGMSGIAYSCPPSVKH